MLSLSDYLLKLSVSFGIISLFYHFVLRRLTFFNWNRQFLLLYSAICFAFPLIDVNTAIERYPTPLPARSWVQAVPSITRPAPVPHDNLHAFFDSIPEIDTPGTAPTNWFIYLWIAGMVAMTLRLLVHVRSYLHIRSHARLVSDDDVKIYHFDLEISPFSFGKSIFYNPHLHEPGELQDMILHEYIHARQWHSVDVIWSELLCIVNWYNPFVWLLRSAVRQNLEYIADQKVLENHADTKAYQYLLVKMAMGTKVELVNQFGYHSLKERIVMINKASSPRILQASFLFILPLLAVMLAAFRIEQPGKANTPRMIVWSGGQETSKNKPKNLLHLSGILMDAETGKPVSGYELKLFHDEKFIKTITSDGDGFYFVQVPAKPDPKVLHNYSLRHEGGEYGPFITGRSYQAGIEYGDSFEINFLKKPALSGLAFTSYGVPTGPYYETYDAENAEKRLKAYLMKSLPPLAAEVRLRIAYFTLKQWPKGVITLYKGAYFDRKKHLMGYEGQTKLFLDGKEASYKQVNEAFKDYPYLLTDKQEKRSTTARDGLSSEISYLTFPLYRDSPPAALVKGNVEEVNVRNFNVGRLKTEAYLLDGFRQVYGVSSNMMPLPEEIKRVMRLKGRLARYYDPNLDEIWWIETRPVNEVFERPNFASR